MTKPWLIGLTALVMMSGGAFAQNSSTSTQTTTSTAVPAVGSHSATKSQTTIDSNGVKTDANQNYSTGASGSNASSSVRTSSHEERAAAPDGSTSTTSHSSTSTTTH